MSNDPHFSLVSDFQQEVADWSSGSPALLACRKVLGSKYADVEVDQANPHNLEASLNLTIHADEPSILDAEYHFVWQLVRLALAAVRDSCSVGQATVYRNEFSAVVEELQARQRPKPLPRSRSLVQAQKLLANGKAAR